MTENEPADDSGDGSEITDYDVVDEYVDAGYEHPEPMTEL